MTRSKTNYIDLEEVIHFKPFYPIFSKGIWGPKLTSPIFGALGVWNYSEISFNFTCIGLQILRGHHDNKADRPFVAEHLIGPAADGAHAFDRRNAIVGNEDLENPNTRVTRVDLFTLLVSVVRWGMMMHSLHW